MSDESIEVLHELRAIRLMQQATLHALYSLGGITPNPIPFVAFPVLPEVAPVADRQAELEDAFRAFGIVLAEDV